MRLKLSLEESEMVLAPHLSKLTSSIKKGFTDYMDLVGYDCYSKERIITFNSRTKATLIQNLILERIKENFANVPGVACKEYKGVFGLLIGNQIFIRFNKFNKRLEPAKAKTTQSKKFEKQQTVIKGFPRKPMFLYAGYTFTSSMTGIGSIHLALRVKGHQEWIKELFNGLAIQQPIANLTPVIEKPAKRVRVKQTVQIQQAS
ncbi:hypothetical protein [Cytophaga hutchinsonii]|nr:hypothetical protein [Cytophaga hutchinsonii]SFX61241.1 hypothetical protein SAMN04487930_106152 [Cytophaga hutchinsonii ATCC 33406]